MNIDLVKKVLSYDPETGILRWKVNKGPRARAGAIAGTPDGKGYIQVKVDYKLRRAHRIAWAITHGEWPKAEIDHINGVRDDNRLANLREATSAENKQNTRTPRSHGKAGLLGVSWDAKRGAWHARIAVGGMQKSIGRFKTAEAAHAAYLEAKRVYHPFQAAPNECAP
jgi:hypothetical protein